MTSDRDGSYILGETNLDRFEFKLLPVWNICILRSFDYFSMHYSHKTAIKSTSL